MSTVDLLQLLTQLELELHAPSTRRSDRAAQLLADDFTEVGGSGRIYDKAQTLAALCDEPPAGITASDFQLRVLTPDMALLTYLARRAGAPPTHSLRSSLWQSRQGQWRLVFHQGTIVAQSH